MSDARSGQPAVDQAALTDEADRRRLHVRCPPNHTIDELALKTQLAKFGRVTSVDAECVVGGLVARNMRTLTLAHPTDVDNTMTSTSGRLKVGKVVYRLERKVAAPQPPQTPPPPVPPTTASPPKTPRSPRSPKVVSPRQKKVTLPKATPPPQTPPALATPIRLEKLKEEIVEEPSPIRPHTRIEPATAHELRCIFAHAHTDKPPPPIRPEPLPPPTAPVFAQEFVPMRDQPPTGYMPLAPPYHLLPDTPYFRMAPIVPPPLRQQRVSIHQRIINRYLTSCKLHDADEEFEVERMAEDELSVSRAVGAELEEAEPVRDCQLERAIDHAVNFWPWQEPGHQWVGGWSPFQRTIW